MSSSQPPNDQPSAMSRLLSRPTNPATVAQSTKAVAQPRSLRREAQLNVLIVRCANEWFAIPAAAVVHVTRVSKVHTLPHRTATGFRGLAALSGAIVPVIDLAALLGLLPVSESLASNSRMVAVGDSHSPLVFEADDVPGVYAIAQSAVQPLPLTVDSAPRRISSGLILTPHGSASLIDPERLFAEFRSALA